MASYRQSFSTSGPADFPGALVQLSLASGPPRKPQMFVEHVVFPNHAAVHRRMLPDIDPVYPVLNSFSIAPGTNPDQAISVTISTTDATRLFVLLSKTQTTPPTASLLRVSGVSLAGTTTNYTFTGLD